MIYGYAIEPAALIGWSKEENELEWQYIIESFGVEKGRLLAEFPKLKTWRKQFRRYLNELSEIERTKLEELFKHLTEKYISNNSTDYNGEISWLNNAEKEMDRKLFHAVIAEENLNNRSYVLKSNSIAKWSKYSKEYWNVGDEKGIMPRKAEYIAEKIYPMIRNSERVCFIDPYLRLVDVKNDKTSKVTESKWYMLFKLIFEKVSCEKISKKIDFEIHISAELHHTKLFSQQYYEHINKPKLSPLIPSLCTVTVIRWKQRTNGEKLHNRYILTDIGGVHFGTGLDEGNEGETDDITLMKRDAYQKRWEQYCGESPAFDLDFKFSVSK